MLPPSVVPFLGSTEPSIGMPNDIRDLVLMPSAYIYCLCLLMTYLPPPPLLFWKDWRRRFFILKGARLFFAKSPHDAPHGMIDLSRCTTVKSADLKAHKKHSFEISTPETTYLLYAGE